MPKNNSMFHGGVVRVPGPFNPETKAAGESHAQAFAESMERGLKALEDGTAPFARDYEVVPGAAVQVLDMFDLISGDHFMIWRVACRERAKHAN